MKKIITIVMVVILLTLFSIGTFTLYSGSKQVNTANNVFDNTVELLKSRNFSNIAINEIANKLNDQCRFTILKKSQAHYNVKMDYVLTSFGKEELKTIESDVYFAG